jgi:hypothetical protein
MEAILMIYKYNLPDFWIEKIRLMEEFANGATQVTITLKNGIVVSEVLISDASYIVAIRGYFELPFLLSDIFFIHQTDIDKNPVNRGAWIYWDDWNKK